MFRLHFFKQLFGAEKMTKMHHDFAAHAENNLCRQEPYKILLLFEKVSFEIMIYG